LMLMKEHSFLLRFRVPMIYAVIIIRIVLF